MELTEITQNRIKMTKHLFRNLLHKHKTTSTMKLTFTGYTKDGHVFFRNQKNISSQIINSGWKEFDITVEKKKKHRSIAQNRYYWSALTILSHHTGFSKDELHNILRFKFLKTTLADTKTGELYEYIKSTTELTTTEMEVYLAEIRQFASEALDCYLGEPNEQLSMSEMERT